MECSQDFISYGAYYRYSEIIAKKEAYEMFQKKEHGAVKVVLHPQIS